MSQIKIANLTFSHEGSLEPLFEDVSFQIDTDWKLGFVGRNGRGKTTFLNLLLGKYPYQGTITHSVAFDYFPFAVGDSSLPTGEVLDRLLPGHPQWELLRELSLLELDEGVLCRIFDTLSSGEQTKVLLAALFCGHNRFLLIDEPTNHLDTHGRALVSRYLSRKQGFILVSHDRSFLDGCADHILSINRTNLEVTRGNFSTWLANKQCQDNFELAEHDRLKKEVRRLDQAAKEKAAWSDRVEKTKFTAPSSGLRPDRGYIGHRAAKMMKRAKAIENRRQSAAAEKVKLLGNLDRSESLKIGQLPFHQTRLVCLKNVSVFYGAHAACRDVSFDMEAGDRVSLSGRNGSGKSSILKLICGEDISYQGGLTVQSGLILSCIPQSTSFLSGGLSAFARTFDLDESQFKTILRKLGFERAQFDRDMSDFSAGQKKKVLLAKSLCEKAHLYVWDEPLNYVDVISRMQIEELLLEYRPTVLFVEHDSLFCSHIATKTVCL